MPLINPLINGPDLSLGISRFIRSKNNRHSWIFFAIIKFSFDEIGYSFLNSFCHFPIFLSDETITKISWFKSHESLNKSFPKRKEWKLPEKSFRNAARKVRQKRKPAWKNPPGISLWSGNRQGNPPEKSVRSGRIKEYWKHNDRNCWRDQID